MYLQLHLTVEVVQHRIYIAPRQVPVSQQKTVRYQELSVVSHKQVHECAAKSVGCAMSSRRYLNLRGRGSPFDHACHSAPCSPNFTVSFVCVGSRELLFVAIGCAQVTEFL